MSTDHSREAANARRDYTEGVEALTRRAADRYIAACRADGISAEQIPDIAAAFRSPAPMVEQIRSQLDAEAAKTAEADAVRRRAHSDTVQAPYLERDFPTYASGGILPGFSAYGESYIPPRESVERTLEKLRDAGVSAIEKSSSHTVDCAILVLGRNVLLPADTDRLVDAARRLTLTSPEPGHPARRNAPCTPAPFAAGGVDPAVAADSGLTEPWWKIGDAVRYHDGTLGKIIDALGGGEFRVEWEDGATSREKQGRRDDVTLAPTPAETPTTLSLPSRIIEQLAGVTLTPEDSDRIVETVRARTQSRVTSLLDSPHFPGSDEAFRTYAADLRILPGTEQYSEARRAFYSGSNAAHAIRDRQAEILSEEIAEGAEQMDAEDYHAMIPDHLREGVAKLLAAEADADDADPLGGKLTFDEAKRRISVLVGRVEGQVAVIVALSDAPPVEVGTSAVTAEQYAAVRDDLVKQLGGQAR